MSRASDRISSDIACLDTVNLPATLISTQGAHCNVWLTGGYKSAGAQTDVVIKRHTLSCSRSEAMIYHRDYSRLKKQLGDIIPTALFSLTLINGEENLLVLAYACKPWFNIANPANEEEALPLLKKLGKARLQLRDFVTLAREYRKRESKVVDLYGLDNLVLDKNQEIRYLDSFEVFFYEDMLHLIDDPGHELEQKINLSLKRLEYLEYLIENTQ